MYLAEAAGFEPAEAINPSGGVITSDTMNHPFVLELSKRFKMNLKIY